MINYTCCHCYVLCTRRSDLAEQDSSAHSSDKSQVIESGECGLITKPRSVVFVGQGTGNWMKTFPRNPKQQRTAFAFSTTQCSFNFEHVGSLYCGSSNFCRDHLPVFFRSFCLLPVSLRACHQQQQLKSLVSLKVSFLSNREFFSFSVLVPTLAMAQEPVEGILCEADDSNIFEWTIWIEGSKGSP